MMNKLRKAVLLIFTVSIFLVGCSKPNNVTNNNHSNDQNSNIMITESDSNNDNFTDVEEGRFEHTVEENSAVLTYLTSQYGIEVGDEIPQVILDTDMTFLGDDAFCLSLLVQADNVGLIDLGGVTITGGNSFVSVGTNATLRQLELWGRPDIPVYMGTDKPINGFRNLDEQSQIVGSIDRWGAMTKLDSYVEPNNFHDLGKYFESKWGYSETIPQNKFATDFLIETVLANKNNVTIISIGSPISIAMACQMDNEFAKNVKEIVYYGGILGEKGTYTPYADFNCFYDATAFKVCLNADFPKQVMVPHEVVGDVKINKTVYDLIERKGSTQISDFWVSNQGGLYRRNVNRKDSCADVIAAIVSLAPSTVVAYQESKVDIIDDVTSAEYGKLTINSSSENPNVSFVIQLDTNRYWNFATDLLSYVSVVPEVTYEELLSENSSN